MKRISWTVVTLICLLLIIMGLLTMLSTRFPLPWQCSKLYWQYRDQEGIKATYVRDYPVDDTTLVDVTLLHATTDSAWVKLCQETFSYNYPDSIKEEILHGKAVTLRVASEDNIRKTVIPTDTTRCNVVFYSAKTKHLIVFRTENKAQVLKINNKITLYLINLEFSQTKNNNQNPLP